jgi:hypothetical protein
MGMTRRYMRKHPWMKNWPCQLDVPKITWTFQHPFATHLTLEIPFDNAHSGVHEPSNFRLVSGLVYDLWTFYFGNQVGFLSKRE